MAAQEEILPGVIIILESHRSSRPLLQATSRTVYTSATGPRELTSKRPAWNKSSADQQVASSDQEKH